jgi:citrate synthase
MEVCDLLEILGIDTHVPTHDDTLALLLEAHAKAAAREGDNGMIPGSTLAARLAGQGSGNLAQALAAGLLTIGDRHAPLQAVRALLDAEDPAGATRALVRAGRRVPGFGNAFCKPGELDPLFMPVWDRLRALARGPGSYRDAWMAMVAVAEELPPKAAELAPNAAMLTAVACRACGLPPGYEVLLFLLGRAGAWTRGFVEDRAG